MNPRTKTLYKVAIIENTFGKLKDWRRIATRYDYKVCYFFFSATCLAVTVLFYLN